MLKHFILMVEDHYELASTLCEFLEEHGFMVDHARNLSAARQLLKQQRYHILLLDINLPDGSGYELCKWLRNEEGLDLPVLMLTARDTLDDKLKGFNSGTDDYLVKPFELPELLARVRVLERRRASVASNTVQRGSLVLDLNAMTLTWKGQLIDLPRREWMLLRLLVENPTRVYSRAQIEEAMYGWGEGADSNAIDVHVHHLRRRIDPDVVQTVRGVGYRLGDLE